MTIWKPMRRLVISLPEELVVNLDEAAKDYYMSRSEYIRLELRKSVLAHYDRQKKRSIHIPQGLEDDPRFFDLDDS
jgi:metal-responsive CopG/Arc/MetJ family transcriptional regulator